MATIDFKNVLRPGISHLTVTEGGKTVTRSVLSMTQQQLKNALLMPVNHDAIAGNYYVSGDKILTKPDGPPVQTVLTDPTVGVTPGGGGGGAAAPADPAPVALPPWAYNPEADPDYVKAYGDAEAEYLGEDRGFAAQLSGLTAKGFTGQTMYDYLMSQNDKARVGSTRDARRNAARRGAAVGGWIDQQKADIGTGYAKAWDSAVREYGTDLTDSRSKASVLTQQRGVNQTDWDALRPQLSNTYRNAATARHNLGG